MVFGSETLPKSRILTLRLDDEVIEHLSYYHPLIGFVDVRRESSYGFTIWLYWLGVSAMSNHH